MLHRKFKNAVFSSLLRFGSFNSSKQISLVTIFFIGFIANKKTLVFFRYWICCKQRYLSELAWCARNKRPCELPKKRSSPQSDSLSVWNFGISVPNLGEAHKF